MKTTLLSLCALTLAGTFTACNPATDEPATTDYTQYVNPFIGAADNGHTFPGAARPSAWSRPAP